MKPYTVVMDIHNEEIKAIVQVHALTPAWAQSVAFKRVHDYTPFPLVGEGMIGVCEPGSSFDVFVIEGHPVIHGANDYNIFDLNIFEKLAAIEEAS